MMLQPPDRVRSCPLCGTNARLLMNVDGMLPQLTAGSEPQYYCLQCRRLTIPYEQQDGPSSMLPGRGGKPDA